MLPSGSHSESARAPYQYDQRSAEASHPPQHTYGYPSRPTIELPRPLEPRPTLISSLSESSGTQRHHQDAFRGPGTGAIEYRAQAPSLPGLRDILTPGAQASSHTLYNAQWSPPTSATHHRNDNYYSQSNWHPPLAHPQHVEAHPSYQPLGRRLEPPILETSPAGRHPPQSLPVSPYTGYPEARDYADGRAEKGRQLSSTSYRTNGVLSPYSSASEDAQYRNNIAGYDRPPNVPMLPGGAEAQRKYLGIKDVPGEGAYHLYEGGFRIPTQVDGEQVNPAWGLTKANKPRKRLALACLDCREKKIKCEPGANSCLQCEKAKRVCRRAPNLPTQADTAIVPVWQPSAASPPARKGVSDPTPQSSHNIGSDPSAKRRSREDPSPPNVPNKKHRSASPNLTSDSTSTVAPASQIGCAPVAVGPPRQETQRDLMWEEDPCGVDKGTTLHLLDLYFTHVNNSAYSLYPRRAYTQWVTESSQKCQLELMALYSVLAMGSVFADDTLSGFGKRCAQIAKDAISAKRGFFNLPVIHSRLLMSMYEIAKGSEGIAWDYTGSAIRACTNNAMRLHVEKGCDSHKDDPPGSRREFNLDSEQLSECKRRTFWLCFLMDRLEYGTTCAITLQDIFLKLPCTHDEYECGVASTAPSFNNGIIDPAMTILHAASPICHMGWLCLLSAIWGDVLTFLNRMIHRPAEAFREAYEAFYSETHNRLQGWSSRLPEYLQYSDTNLARSMRNGYGGVFMSMHALHNFILMRLNRHIRHGEVSLDLAKRNTRAARHHASTMLTMMLSVRTTWQQIASESKGDREPVDPLLSSPFVGRATIAAVDIAGAGGFDSSIGATLDAITPAMDCLRQLARCWNSAKSQLDRSSKRYYQIQNIVSRPYKANSGAWLGRKWGLKDPLETGLGGEPNLKHDWEHDCIYPTTGDDGYSRSFFEALEEDTHNVRSPSGSVRIV